MYFEVIKHMIYKTNIQYQIYFSEVSNIFCIFNALESLSSLIVL